MRTPTPYPLTQLQAEFGYYETIRDLIDQSIDITLNYRQSGHPGGSRSKAYMLVVCSLSGAMRWDIREPGKRFADRFVLVAGHTVPLVYAMLAVYNEALRIKYEQTNDPKYLVKEFEQRALVWEDLLTLRRRDGLPGHAEMAGKTQFLKFNTGPSGHGSPAAAGIALAYKLAGVPEVKVWAFEGEGGLTAGVTHETLNSAYGLGLSNLNYILDWNDYGIDDRPFSSVIHGNPDDWFQHHGFHTVGTMEGEDWEQITKAFIMLNSPDGEGQPKMLWTRNRKGRGYGVFDNKSHGAVHKPNSEQFWAGMKQFALRQSVSFENIGEPRPASERQFRDETASHLSQVMSVLRNNQKLLDFLAERLVDLGDSVPEDLDAFVPGTNFELDKGMLSRVEEYPEELFVKPGTKAPNRAALAKFGAWINKLGHDRSGAPLFIAASADLADSTNISGFAKGWDEFDGFGWYERDDNPQGALLPQAITEFANAGILAGMTTVNFSKRPYDNFNGFLGACSTYGSFSYLKYGAMRLFSQVAQDSELKVGRLLWIAGHSGPETAEDSRTHFGIFAPGVTQLFPEGQILNLHPWEHNEVAPVLGAALATDVPIIALHLTRPPISIPERDDLEMPSHLEAAKGAYIIKDYDKNKEKAGVVIIRGTSPTNSLMKILPRIKDKGPNVKIVAAISYGLLQRQTRHYQEQVLSAWDWDNSMIVANQAYRLMQNWVGKRANRKFALTPDWDNRWRTGGTLEEIVEESHLDPGHILEGIMAFAERKRD
ncbi:MAG: 1-deoxy-D-xylulose-5-phosphate synthase N-terminal domain-containing protein [Candidatus Neomarinimicrobiota bacterium]